MSTTLRMKFLVIAFLATACAPVSAQDTGAVTPYELPRGWITAPTPGLVAEPSTLSKLAMATDTALGGEPHDGVYISIGNVITGSGWIAAGPGYRHTVFDGRTRLNFSAAVSSNLYRVAQASLDLPRLWRERLSLGVQARYQDALAVRFFGLGGNSKHSDESAYRINNVDVAAYGRLRVRRWLTVDGRVGVIPHPDVSTATGPGADVPSTVDRFSDATAPGLVAQPRFIHTDVAVMAERLDRAGYPAVGGVYRAAAAVYSDRDAGAYTFRRYELEASQMVPVWTKKWVLAARAWEVFSDTADGAQVPFYLMPSLGGRNTLRGFDDYRFHDNNAQSVSLESRWALWTHMDVALFADAGKVARDASDLDLRHTRKAYGAGLRFHNATSTLLRLDAGHGHEGWHVFVSLVDPFTRSTPAAGRPSVVPYVP